MKKKFLPFLCSALVFVNMEDLFSQTTTNKFFSFGSYGRVGVGLSPSITGNVGRPFNLNGMGSIGGRMEESDYVELIAALHFKGKEKSDTPFINVQARMALYATNWQLIGNVNTTSQYGGVTVALPELYAEALNINGSKWSAWIGAKFFRGYDVHIADYFYFDDHSTQGLGVSYNKTTFSILFPGAVDTSSSVPPYYYVNIVDGTPRLGLRGRTVLIGEQLIPFDNNKQTLKILGEYHHLADANLEDTATAYNYPAAGGWVAGVEHTILLNKLLAGSSNQAAIRYGKGIANGNDGGNSKTWLTYGAPDLSTYKYNQAYSITLVDQLLMNISPKYSINAYGIFTKSHGASDSLNKAPDFFGREIYNRKTEYALGLRNFWYIKPWFLLMTELHYANRKDGDQPAASLIKFSFVPTIVPTLKTDPWARPQLRLIYTICRYNDYAAGHSYSPFLSEVGNKIWGHYIGFRAEWWLF